MIWCLSDSLRSHDPSWHALSICWPTWSICYIHSSHLKIIWSVQWCYMPGIPLSRQWHHFPRHLGSHGHLLLSLNISKFLAQFQGFFRNRGQLPVPSGCSKQKKRCKLKFWKLQNPSRIKIHQEIISWWPLMLLLFQKTLTQKDLNWTRAPVSSSKSMALSRR